MLFRQLQGFQLFLYCVFLIATSQIAHFTPFGKCVKCGIKNCKLVVFAFKGTIEGQPELIEVFGRAECWKVQEAKKLAKASTGSGNNFRLYIFDNSYMTIIGTSAFNHYF
ncbi:MAG: hypothetical protein A2Y21_11535 [Clostridiales bacterium GWC2_40_7]|nr:MAG: hypothetical protein A2Y21_11535 [Clostridiales bacterium GWC2_40_7]